MPSPQLKQAGIKIQSVTVIPYMPVCGFSLHPITVIITLFATYKLNKNACMLALFEEKCDWG
jgi:hypothetical protein